MPDPTSRPTATRPDIVLANGRVLRPRDRFASELQIHPRTLARMNPATTRIGGIAYVDVASTLADIAAGLRRRNEPVKRRRSK
jgi:hypothetical protein